MAPATALTADQIRAARRDAPTPRARDFAESLGLAEAQLLAAHQGHGATRITAHPDRLMPAVEGLGEVMALTRMAGCVHEKIGRYGNYQSGDHACMVLNGVIDLRLFPRHWVHGFAVEEMTDTGPRRSLQVFDAAGDAVHKIHLRDRSDHAAWAGLVAELALSDAPDTLVPDARAAPEAAKLRTDRAEDLRTGWDRLTDTHQFLMMVARLKMNRLGAYRLAGAPYARALAPSAMAALLDRLAQGALPVMIFVGNPGCIQIHSGPIRRIEGMGPWLNVLDPGFNLHLRGDHVAELWEVHKPTRRGPVTSVEAFNAQGRILCQIFGTHKPQDRMAEFADLVAGLPARAAEVPA
ncbi:hemin-degrading factor [Salipiger marinus]|uniref:Putative hemin transport protein n=1 Tax=Salipiger marinus TaxID=555512 RepID=A0A1G8P275_9RHOB|nr:ChuX/HutX family heme-like substrate-binding protein [Salipiger marinus]SDI86532.1 putative hemin transport protein [Salipiger marinus]